MGRRVPGHGEAAADRVARTRVVEYYAATEGLGTFVDSHAGSPVPHGGQAPVDEAVIVADEDGWRSCRAKRPRVPARRGAARFAYYGDEEKTSAAFRGEYSPWATSVTSTRTATCS